MTNVIFLEALGAEICTFRCTMGAAVVSAEERPLRFSPLWWRVALLHLLLIAFAGLLLRWMLVSPVQGLNFRNILHAHSHGALLGWLYSAFFVALLHAYLPQQMRNKGSYAWLFWLSQLAVLGMLLSFPVQGYAAVSITFSTLHILLSYGFAWRFWRDVEQLPDVQQRHAASIPFVKLSLLLMVLSTLGPWSLGPIMATGYSGSELYFNAIYFYLHFQYNGWFTFAALGLFFRLLEHYQIHFSRSIARAILQLLALAIVPAYLLSVLWTEPAVWLYAIGGAAALVQLVALVLLAKLLWQIRGTLQMICSKEVWLLFGLSLVACGIKMVLQVASALPVVALLAYKVRLFVIGYLHLTLIGFVSLFLLGYFAQLGWLKLSARLTRTGLGLFLTGFFLSELCIFTQGIAFWLRLGAFPYFNEAMFGVSALLPVGLLLLAVGQLRYAKAKQDVDAVSVKQIG